MGKTWKDKPLNVEDVPVYKRRKRTPKPQPEDAEAEMLKALRTTDLSDSEIEETMENWREVWSA